MRTRDIPAAHLTFIALAAAIAATAPSHALNDPYLDLFPGTAPHLSQERIPHADQTFTHRFAFSTVPGVGYTIETSPDLTEWTPQEEIYGVGQEIAVPMIRTQPPPNTPPAPPPANPGVSVWLMMQHATAGGIVVYWHSLSAPAVGQRYRFFRSHHFPNLVPDPAWDNQIAYVKCFGSHNFSVAHPRAMSIAPANEPHEAADQAMLDVFEASFATMNQEVHDHTAAVVEIQPPPPPDPNSKKFFRVRADWGIDSDGDGNPDWLEMDGAAAFAAANPGVTPAGLRYDAFNADTDGNGQPDGQQTDRDGDGVTDNVDANVRAGLATSGTVEANGQDATGILWSRPPGFCFAGFVLPVDPDQACVDISPNGTVFFNNFAEIAVTDVNLDTHWSYLADWFEIAAGGIWLADDVPTLMDDSVLATREVEDPEFGTYGQEGLWNPADGTFQAYLFPGNHDSLLDSRGAFQVRAHMPNADQTLLDTPQGTLQGTGWEDAGARIEESGNIASGTLYWRYDPQTGAYGEPSHMPFISGCTARVTQGADHWTLAASGGCLRVSKNDAVFAATKVTLPPGETPLGATRHGWLATTGHIWDHDLWTRLRKRTGDLGVNRAEMLRMSDSGMAVARLLLRSETGPSQQAMCLLAPLSAEPEDAWNAPTRPDSHALGVDDISMLAYSGDGRVPEIWIMVPASGTVSKNVTLRGAFSPQSGVTLSAADNKLAFAPANLGAPETAVSVTSPLTATEDVPIVLTRGGKQASNHPLKAKVMKKRVVKVALHRVKGVDAAGQASFPRLCPAPATLTAALNAIYEPQVNVTFEITPCDEDGGNGSGVDFDKDDDGELNASDLIELNSATPNGKVGQGLAHIDIWVVGGVKLTGVNKFGVKSQAYGSTVDGDGRILIDGARIGLWPNTVAATEMEMLYAVIAHEIGHAMGLEGHPGEQGYKQALDWETGTDPFLVKRLMCPGEKINWFNPGTCLIKKEWDRIEAWLKALEDNGKL